MMAYGEADEDGQRFALPAVIRRPRHLIRWICYGITAFAFLWVLLSRHGSIASSATSNADATKYLQPDTAADVFPGIDTSPAERAPAWIWKDVQEIYALYGL